MAKFSVRDLFWLAAVVVLSGWLWLDSFWMTNTVEHAKEAQATAEMFAAELRANGYDVTVERHGRACGSGPFKSLVTTDELRYAAERREGATSR